MREDVMKNRSDFEKRCDLVFRCLPSSPFREMVKSLHDDMLNAINRKLLIAQCIRDAAINWPQFLGDVECDVIRSFHQELAGDPHWSSSCYFESGNGKTHQARTFMLLVAEALE